ncbi:hypothetical protein HDU98_005414 [Podochytrium sp. JEL0797]|nr:hypothetical protein HDU98_005414 [Podochytrium sp. JEL0797]
MTLTGIRSIQIPRAATRDYPSRHTSYMVCVRGEPPCDGNSWVIWKRYSEFYVLDAALRALFPDASLPCALPPKTTLAAHAAGVAARLAALATPCASPTTHPSASTETRRARLEAYLVALLDCRDECWRTAPPFAAFLGLRGGSVVGGSVSSPGGAPTTPSLQPATLSMHPNDWITELQAVRTTCQHVRQLIAEKDILAATTPPPTSKIHAALAHIRAEVKKLSDRVDVLDSAFRIHASTHPVASLESPASFPPLPTIEIQRREDLLVSLKDEKDKIVQQLSHSAQSAHSSLLSRNPSNNSLSTSNELFRHSTTSSTTTTPRRRAFGRPQETPTTLPLTNHGLVSLQNQTMNDQDAVLDSLSTLVRNQKAVGAAIGSELDVQNQMLREIGEDVDRVAGGLKHAGKRLEGVMGGKKTKKPE